jgi:DNA-binding transcriptional ArsR family regulator
VPFERIKPRRPVRSIRLQPRVELHQRLRAEPVQPPLSIPPDLHQPRVAQHSEVTRHTWLMHPDLLDQLTDRLLAAADGIKDSPPCRFSDHLENSDFCWHADKHTASHIYVQPHVGPLFTGERGEPPLAPESAVIGTLATPPRPAPESVMCSERLSTEACPRTCAEAARLTSSAGGVIYNQMVVDTLEREKQTDRLFFALSDATRRDIVTQTLDRERSVSELGRLYPISLTAVQKHVEVLVDAGLVSKHRSGREQLVRGEVNQLRRAHELLDELETVWRARLERFEDVLNETTGKENE